jgi:ATP-dependent exoDNAse (exonuclease V) alpha subunit
MATFSWSMQVIKRSAGRSAVAAAAYRAGEKLWDERQSIAHDYSRRSGVEHRELIFPDDAPAWCQGLDRERLWNAVEAAEKRKDAQTARELRVMIPREVPPERRVALVRDYITRSFVAKGMVADVAWHNKTASDGLEQPHAHIMLTMRPLAADGFGKKSRHDWVPDPEGRTHPDGRPVMVESNADSWNSVTYFEQCREDWENVANAALERAGSAERIDRRSLLARGLSRLPEPALRLAHYLTDLYGCMRERFGQFQMARHYRSVEERAKDAFRTMDHSPTGASEAARTADRFFGWFERQLERLHPSPRDIVRTTPAPEVGRDR